MTKFAPITLSILALISTINAVPRIIGGQPVRAGQFPFNAALEIRTNNSAIFCSGALINNDWILTAAQCLEQAVSVTIKLGSIHLKVADPNRVTVSSSHFVIHPNYNRLTLENDIALIKLRIPIQFSEYVQSLPLSSFELPPNGNIKGFALGWGSTSDNDAELSDFLNYVSVSSLSTQECKLTYGEQVNDNMICMEGNYNQGTCIGDIGGALIISSVGGRASHFGVASFLSGNGCESTDPSGFTKTFAFIDWINSTIN